MKLLKPLRVEVDCVYSCPDCEAETWHTVRELEELTYLNCVCGTRTKLQIVDSVDVVYAGKTVGGDSLDKTGRAVTAAMPTPSFNHGEFIATLTNMGHQASWAKTIVEQCAHEYDGDDGKFLSFLLKKGQ